MTEATRHTPESTRERIESHAEIFGAVDRGLETLKKYKDIFKDENKAQVDWIISSVDNARKKVNDKGKMTVSDGEGNSQEEGIPVDDMMEFLDSARTAIEKKMRELNKAVSEHRLVEVYRNDKADGKVPAEFDFSKNGTYTNEREASHAWAESLAESARDIGLILKTIEKNSKNYFDLRPDMKGDKQHWRTRTEAGFISGDFRSTGDVDNDYKKAMKVMGKRRELVLPPELGPVPTVIPTTEVIAPPPETATEDSEILEVTEPTTETREREREPERIEEPTVADVQPPNKPAFLVDISEIVRRLAMTQAEEKLNEYLTKELIAKKSELEKEKLKKERKNKGWFSRFGSRVKEAAKSTLKTVKNFGERVYVRLSEKQYLNKFYQEALSEIQSNKNLMTEINAKLMRKSKSKELSHNALDRNIQALDEIINTYVEEVEEAEERGEKISDPQVNAELSSLFYRYATGELTDRASFDAEVEEKVIKRFFAGDATDKKDVKFTTDESRKQAAEGLMFAHNFFEMAKTYKTYVEQKINEAVERFGPENREAVEGHVRALLALDVQLGLKEKDIRETKPAEVLTFFDKMIDKAQSVPVLGKLLASPTAWGAGTAAAVALAVRRGVALPLSALAGAPGVGAVFGGFIGAARRGRDLKYDRGLELRRKALGLEPGGKRSEKMREYTQSMIEIDNALGMLKALEKKKPEDLTETEKRFVAGLFARLAIEKSTQADLFTAQKEEANKTSMRVGSMTNLKKALRDFITTHPIMDRGMEQLMQEESDKILIELSRTDDKFKSFRKKEMVKAGVFGAVVGCVAGAGAEAGIKALSGEFEQSTVAKLGEYLYGNSDGSASQETATNLSQATHEVLIPGTDSKIVLPENLHLTEHNGLLNIEDADGNVIIKGANVDIDGRFDPHTLGKLEEMGFGVEQYTVVNVPETHIGTHEELIPGTNTKVVLPENLKFVESGGNLSIVNENGDIILDDLHTNATGGLDSTSLEKLGESGWKVLANTEIIPGTGLIFSGNLHEVSIPGLNPDVTIKIPDELNLVPDGSGSFIMEDQNGFPVAQGIEFTPQGRFTNETLAMFEKSGWGLSESLNTEEAKITDPDSILEYMRQNFGREGHGAVYGNRVYHGNIDVPSRQPTSLDNPFFKGKYERTGHFPYKYDADEAVAEASKKSVAEGVLDKAVKPGETVSGRIFEGKELRGILYDRKNEHVFSFKKGLNDMFQRGKVNWDQSVDNKYWTIKHLIDSARGSTARASEHFSIRFYLNSEEFRANQAFAVPLGPDGQLHIPKDSELAKILFDQKTGKLLATWEVSCDVPAGDHITPHALATDRSREAVTEILTEKTTITTELSSPKALDQALTDYSLTPPTEPPVIDTTTVLTAPDLAKVAETPPWFIPIPFVPRWAMERPAQRGSDFPQLYTLYRNPETKHLLDIQHDPLFSSTLRENPRATLDPQIEIDRYLNINKERREELEGFDEQIGEPMDENCRIAICIPCAAHMEKDNIEHTLELYTKQIEKKGKPLDPSKFEIILFLNRPKNKADDGTTAIVRQFQADHPELKIRVMEQETDWGKNTSWGEQVNLGSICRRIYDTALLRASKRENKEDLILLMNDADALDISPELVAEHIKMFEKDSEQRIDGIVGEVDWGKDTMNNPNLFAFLRFYQAIEKQRFQNKDPEKKQLQSWGANFSIRSSSYAAIGGRRDYDKYGVTTDLLIGEHLIKAREPKDGRHTEDTFPLRYAYHSWVDSSPRNMLPLLKQHGLLVGEDIGPEQSIESLSLNKLEESLNALSDLYGLVIKNPNVAKDENEKTMINDSLEAIKKTLAHMGVSYEIEYDAEGNGKIKVLDAKEFKEKLTSARSGEEYFDTMPSPRIKQKR